jgi:osmoprotectant transport system permease protein
MVWLWENLDLVLGLALDHARLSIIPIVVSLIAAVPLGWLATRHPLARSIILVISGAAFTIPSLALFIVLPAVLGTRILDELNVIVALSIYGVAVMARGAADAFASVPRDVINSSTAVGYSRIGRFWAVELPLAGPVILASLRVVAVSTISLLTVGSIIGVQSLGYLFINGYQRTFPTEVVIGIGAVVLLAVLFDQLLVIVGRILLPWTSAQSRTERRRRRPRGSGRAASEVTE